MPRRWKVLSISAAVVVVGCVIAWIRPGADSGVGSDSAPAAAGTWSRRTAYVVGSNDPREILVYSGSEDVKNYRIEFAWVPDTRGVGWIFRATRFGQLLRRQAPPDTGRRDAYAFRGTFRRGQGRGRACTPAESSRSGRTRSQVLVRMDATGPCLYAVSAGKPGGLLDGRAVRDGQFGVLRGAWRTARSAGAPFHVVQKERSPDRGDFTAVICSNMICSQVIIRL